MEQTVLTASGLTMRYHNTLALDNLDMTLPQGKIVGLLGPNGSGKTTFIKLAAGLLTPTAGEITVCGEKNRNDHQGHGLLSARPPLFQPSGSGGAAAGFLPGFLRGL